MDSAEATYPNAILGYKILETNQQGDLFSPHDKSIWNEKTAKAGCNKQNHQAPTDDCTCGLYAYHSLEILNKIKATYHNRVLCLVAGRGKTIITHYGWRAEEEQILAILAEDQKDWQHMQVIADNYSVPLYNTTDKIPIQKNLFIADNDKPAKPAWHSDTIFAQQLILKSFKIGLVSLSGLVALSIINLLLHSTIVAALAMVCTIVGLVAILGIIVALLIGIKETQFKNN